MNEVKIKARGGLPPGLWLAAALAVTALLAYALYAPTIKYVFIDADFKTVVNNEDIRHFDTEGLKDLFSGRDYENYLPVRMAVYSLIYKFSELNPATYHAVNVGFHIANCILAVILAAVLLRTGDRGREYPVLPGAFVAGLIFAVHPIQVEAVAWVSGLKELLAAFFCMLSLLAYIKYRSAPGGRKPMWAYPAALILFILAVMSKATALFLPLAFILFDILFPEEARKSPLFHRLQEHFFTLLAAACGIILNYRLADKKDLILPPEGGSVFIHALTVIKVIPFYLKLIFFSKPLSVVYEFRTASGLTGPGVIVSLGVIVGIVTLILLLRKRAPSAAFGAGFFLIALGPTLNIIPFGTFAADRYAYLPLFGLCLVAGRLSTVFFKGPTTVRVPAAAVVALALLVLTGTTANRVSVWQNSFSLWQETVETNPGSAKANYKVGLAYVARGEIEKSFKYLQRALEIDPELPEAYVAMATYYRTSGEYEKALETLKEGLKQDPDNIDIHYNIGVLLFKMGRYISAAKIMALVDASHPGYKNCIYYLSTSLKHMKDIMYPEDYMDLVLGLGYPEYL